MVLEQMRIWEHWLYNVLGGEWYWNRYEYETSVEGYKALLTLSEAEKNCLFNSELSKVDIANLLKKVAEGKGA